MRPMLVTISPVVVTSVTLPPCHQSHVMATPFATTAATIAQPAARRAAWEAAAARADGRERASPVMRDTVRAASVRPL
jgi:hypothetical protein